MINNSRVNVFTSPSEFLFSMKLAPDGKIYVGHQVTNNYLGVINYPDNSGMSCNYVNSGIYLNGKHSGWGLNNLMEYGYYCNLLTDINETPTQESISIYPNPATFSFTISSTNKIQSIKVFNVIGEVVYKSEPNNNQSTINSNQFAKGIYFVQITDENKNVVNRKILVQ